ncbi:hypothetical protein BaRGS_00021646, partial [Batillaria attramentaria]
MLIPFPSECRRPGSTRSALLHSRSCSCSNDRVQIVHNQKPFLENLPGKNHQQHQRSLMDLTTDAQTDPTSECKRQVG